MGTKEMGFYFSRASKNRIPHHSREGYLSRDMSVVLLGFWLVWLVWAGWCWVSCSNYSDGEYVAAVERVPVLE